MLLTVLGIILVLRISAPSIMIPPSDTFGQSPRAKLNTPAKMMTLDDRLKSRALAEMQTQSLQMEVQQPPTISRFRTML